MSGTCATCNVVVPPGQNECVWCGEPLGKEQSDSPPDRVDTLYDDHSNDGPSMIRRRDTEEMAAMRPTEILQQEEDAPEEPALAGRRPLFVVAMLALLGLAGVATGTFLGGVLLGRSGDATAQARSPAGAIVNVEAVGE